MVFVCKYLIVSIVRQRVAPPPLIRPRETTLGSAPSPQLSDRPWLPASLEGGVQPRDGRSRSPPARITAGMASASAAPTLVGVAETAPPWYSPSSYSYCLI